MFADDPAPTGFAEVDAALKDFLAVRNGWVVPSWAEARTERAEDWFLAVPDLLRETALSESPGAFRWRRIFTTGAGLSSA